MEDKLNRLEIIENLTNILLQLNLENGVVLGLDAGWGKGKTTFVNLWEEYLKQNYQDFNIIKFNAWENDDSGSPLLSFITELDNVFPNNDKFKEKGVKLVKNISINIFDFFLKYFSKDVLNKDIIFNLDENLITKEKERKELKENFKKELIGLSKKKKIIFFIDELDRCKPTYAIELLETIKHLFNIKNCIFVIAWDKLQLSHSIKTVYGNDMDSEGYLRRFIDLDYQLPEPDKVLYLKLLLTKEQIDNKYYQTFYEILPVIINVYDLSLRDIDKLIFYLKIHFNRIKIKGVIPVYQYTYSLLKSLFVIVKLKRTDLYIKIRDRLYTTLEIEEILSLLSVNKIQEMINTDYSGIDDYIIQIIRTFLLCYIDKNNDQERKYVLFKEKTWDEGLYLKYFCGENNIFKEIDFLEDIDN